MRAIAFFPLAIAGTVFARHALYFLGDALAAPLKDFADFVGKYQWYITPLTFALVAVQAWRRRRKNRGFIESVDEFDAELRETALGAAGRGNRHQPARSGLSRPVSRRRSG